MVVYIKIVMIMELNSKYCHIKNPVVKTTMFPHRNIHKYTWTSPDERTHNQIDHILIERIWHSSTPDVRSFREADWDTDHCPGIEKVRERIGSK